MITAASVSSATHTGIYYAPAHLRGTRVGRNIRLVRRDRLVAIRRAYKARRRFDHVERDVIRLDLTGIIAAATAETVTADGEHIWPVRR